jgi:transcriptional regulator with XRE-family HTH domain
LSEQDEANTASGARIKKLREAAGSQESIALQAGIDQSALSKVERQGPQTTSWTKLFALADSLGCVVEFHLTPKREK